MPEFSIVTIVKGRRKQLANLLDSVNASTIRPHDVQIVCMDNPNEIVIPEGLTVRIHVMNEAGELPLAAARNKGVAAAETGNVIFIDVDCIVSPTLFAALLTGMGAETIRAAYPLYLPNVPDSGNYGELIHTALTHPDRVRIPADEPVDHWKFWSLLFAIQKQTFEAIGGFDESFTGYGAEDTDFAMTFHRAGVRQFFVRDYVLHQYHDKYDPPLNYFDSIIENAERYRQKWNVLPMQRWLRAFEELGLIKIDQANNITVSQKPTASQLTNCISPHPY